MTFWETKFGRSRRLKKLGIKAPLKTSDIVLAYSIAGLVYPFMFVFVKCNQWILKALNAWWGPLVGVAVMVFTGQLLFELKKGKLIRYGQLEVAFSLVAGFMSLTNTQNPSWIPTFFGSVYIYVRGVSNIGDARNKLKLEKNKTRSSAISNK